MILEINRVESRGSGEASERDDRLQLAKRLSRFDTLIYILTQARRPVARRSPLSTTQHKNERPPIRSLLFVRFHRNSHCRLPSGGGGRRPLLFSFHSTNL